MFDSVIKLFKAVFNNEGIGQPLLEEEKPEVDLKSMTKKQLEEYGRSLGIELDRRHTKSKLIETLETIDGKNAPVKRIYRRANQMGRKFI